MKSLLLLCTFCFPHLFFAQINESDSLKIKAGLSTTGVFQGGNVETIIFRAKTDFSVKPTDDIVFKNQNSYIYQEFGKQKADEDILSLNFLYLHPEKKIYPFLLGFISTNFRREIDLRYLVGGGATIQLIEQENNWLKVSLSSEYEKTNYEETNFNFSKYDGQETIETVRGTIWANGKYTVIKDRIILSHESYFQPSLEDGDNFRWQADFGLEIPTWKFINFKVDYRRTFENIVIEGQQEQDDFLTFGLAIKNF